MKIKLLLSISLLLPMIAINAQNVFIAGDKLQSDYYFNIDPDKLIQTSKYDQKDTFSIDINNDGLLDLTFKISNWGGDGPLGLINEYLVVVPYNGCSVGIKRVDTLFCAAATRPDNYLNVVSLLKQGDRIDDSIVYKSKQLYIFRHFQVTGLCPTGHKELTDWNNVTDNRYIPIVIKDKYGWIQVKTYYGYSYEKKMAILDYAFEGSQSQIINNLQVDSLIIFPNPSNGKIRVSLMNSDIKKYELTVFDLLGNKVINQDIKDKYTDIDLLNPGVYLFQVKNGPFKIYRKIIIQCRLFSVCL